MIHLFQMQSLMNKLIQLNYWKTNHQPKCLQLSREFQLLIKTWRKLPQTLMKQIQLLAPNNLFNTIQLKSVGSSIRLTKSTRNNRSKVREKLKEIERSRVSVQFTTLQLAKLITIWRRPHRRDSKHSVLAKTTWINSANGAHSIRTVFCVPHIRSQDTAIVLTVAS